MKPIATIRRTITQLYGFLMRGQLMNSTDQPPFMFRMELASAPTTTYPVATMRNTVIQLGTFQRR
jgi:hypothetical protein